MLTESFTKSLREIDIEINGVIKLLNDFNPHKTIGPDNIHIRFLKETWSEIAPALALMYQASIHHKTRCMERSLHISNL